MLTVLAFLKAHWRPVAVLVALVAAFGAGRFATPTKVVTKTEIQTVVKEVEKKTAASVSDTKKDTVRVVYVDRVIYKDGTVHEKTETRTEAKTDTAKVAASTDNTAKTETESVKTEKTVTSDAPRFTVSLLGGYQFRSQFNLIPGAGSWALGVQFQYRVAGPLQVGVFGLTTGVAGVSLGLTF